MVIITNVALGGKTGKGASFAYFVQVTGQSFNVRFLVILVSTTLSYQFAY